jgi:hypothetical protein
MTKKEDDMNHSSRPPENILTDIGLHQTDHTKGGHQSHKSQYHGCFKI